MEETTKDTCSAPWAFQLLPLACTSHIRSQSTHTVCPNFHTSLRLHNCNHNHSIYIVAIFLELDWDELRHLPFAELSNSLNDNEVVEGLYQQVKSEIEAGMSYLLKKREEDPYQDFVPRMLYEKTWGKQAPTFKPWRSLICIENDIILAGKGLHQIINTWVCSYFVDMRL